MVKKIVKKAKTSKPKVTKAAKIAKPPKVAKSKKAPSTLVWKRSKPGRPKSDGALKGSATKARSATKGKHAGKHVLATTKEELLKVEVNGGELRVGQSKFEIGPKQNAQDFQVHNIPFEYGKNRIVFLTVDPKFAFVYWEVQQEKMHDALNSIGHNAKLTLRFHDTKASGFWDTSIFERVGNWYLKLDRPERKLWVEIGMKNDRGDFYSIARSNTMQMPRMGLAGRGPIKWMLVTPAGEKLITEVEDYTDADLDLLKKILGPYFFDLFRRGKFSTITGSSAEYVFMELEEMQTPNLTSQTS